MKKVVIFDIECTCWDESENMPRSERETIEIGAVLVSVEDGKIISSFNKFIKPKNRPILSDYCKTLTTIKQEDVDSANDFKQIMDEFGNWMISDENPIYILSWGYFDRNHIRDESKEKKYQGISLTEISNKHLNLKEIFGKHYGIHAKGFESALRYLNFHFEGTQHRGIDDATNMVKVFNAIKESIFPNYGNQNNI